MLRRRWVFWNLVLVLPPKLSMKLSHLHAPQFPPLCVKHIQSSQGSHTPSTSMACPPDTFSLYLPCVPAPKPCQITSRLSLPCIPQKSLYTAYLCPAVLKRPLTFYKWLADTLLLTKTKHESRPLEALGRVGGAVCSGHGLSLGALETSFIQARVLLLWAGWVRLLKLQPPRNPI